jgi:hypothetical protein
MICAQRDWYMVRVMRACAALRNAVGQRLGCGSDGPILTRAVDKLSLSPIGRACKL